MKRVLLLFLHVSGVIGLVAGSGNDDDTSCTKLKIGQYRCEELQISVETQEIANCKPNNFADVRCEILPGLTCAELHENGTFTTQVPCRYRHGKDFRTALLLSIFLGCFGIDRFYLGYVGIGLFKLCTLGMFFVFHLADIILIALQIVKPADGSYYVIDYYGPRITPINSSSS